MGRDGKDSAGLSWRIRYGKCPSCAEPILNVNASDGTEGGAAVDFFAWPRYSAFKAAPAEVKAEHPDIASDYNEAARILELSPKASAAIGRRCLQHLIRKKAGIKRNYLRDEVAELLKCGLPPYIANDVDYVRRLGNVAAHPEDGPSTSEIVDVEEGEAELVLDVLMRLFEHFYVQPARSAELQAKLAAKRGGSAPGAGTKPNP